MQMRNLSVRFLMVCFLMFIGLTGVATTAWAAENIDKRPLNERFHELVIVPYDFQNKAFISGQITDIDGDYQMYQSRGRVLVPIRLMSVLANEIDPNPDHWETVWQPEKPDEVVLRHSQLGKTIVFTVGSTTMRINDQTRKLDVPPQKIGGRVVLPLRSTAEALEKKIDWLDGLILIGDAYVDLQHPQTLEMVRPLKAVLTDSRQPIPYEERLLPLALYNYEVYFTDQQWSQIYVQREGEPPQAVSFSGEPFLPYSRVIDDLLYYVTLEGEQYALYTYHLRDGTNVKVAALEDWSPYDGWLGSVYSFDGEIYVILHRGDLTMGIDTLYKVNREQARLEKITQAKGFIEIQPAKNFLYYTDFNPIYFANNLYRIDKETGETENIGEPGYTYGISRIIEGYNTSYSGNDSLYVRDGHIYVLGYKEDDLEDQSAVYKVDVAKKTQTKLTPPTEQFWLLDQYLYFIDSESGHLKRVDVDGGHLQTLVERKVREAELYDGQFYYIGEDDQNGAPALYAFQIAQEEETKLSAEPVQSFYVNHTGIYYVSDGLAMGLYKIKREENNRNIRLVQERIESVQLTDHGIVYTLKYEPGIYMVRNGN
jgi:hypothetical protein